MTTSSAETLRAFIAARPDAAAQAELIRVQRDLKRTLDSFNLRVRWTDPETFHITLLFLGDTPYGQIPAILDKMNSVGWVTPPGDCRLSELGLFRKSGTLWVGIDAPPGLLQLQKELACALGFEPGRFHAHFTLGRIKRGLPDQKFFQTLETTVVEPVSFEIRALEFVKSDLLPDGPKHTVLGTVHLQ